MPRKILQENPRENPPNFIQQKSSNTFLQIAQGKKLCKSCARTIFTQFWGQMAQRSQKCFCTSLTQFSCIASCTGNSCLNHRPKLSHRVHAKLFVRTSAPPQESICRKISGQISRPFGKAIRFSSPPLQLAQETGEPLTLRDFSEYSSSSLLVCHKL